MYVGQYDLGPLVGINMDGEKIFSIAGIFNSVWMGMGRAMAYCGGVSAVVWSGFYLNGHQPDIGIGCENLKRGNKSRLYFGGENAKRCCCWYCCI